MRPRLVEPRASSEQQRSKVGFPIRRFPDQSLFAAPRDLSQRTTSFIASQRQGIHQIPLRHLIALIAKARSSKTPHGEKPRFSRGPRSANRGRTLSGAKRPVLLQTHPGILAVSHVDPRLVARRPNGDKTHPRRRGPSRALRRTSRLIRSPTECASSSRCQISKGPRPSGGPRLPTPPHPGPRPRLDAARLVPDGTKPIKIASERTGGSRPKPGGARRDRTDDLMLAKHALSQLSYGPKTRGSGAKAPQARTPRAGDPPGGRTSAPALEAAKWWAWEDLNLRPHAYQARALTN